MALRRSETAAAPDGNRDCASTGDAPMTGAQARSLKTLSGKSGEASMKIAEICKETGKGG